MNIGSLFLSLGIKADTKSLEDAVKKVEELKKQTQELNKALKETKSSSKINVSAAATSTKQAKQSQVLREEAAVGAARLRIAKTELGFLELKEKKESKEEREQKKREKAREKATKDFFNQIENGFSFVAKAFTGGLLAGGIGGYLTSQAAKQVSLSASLKQYGIDPETSQRYANVFRQASGGQVGVPETNAFIANISDLISSANTGDIGSIAKLSGFARLGIDPSQIVDFKSLLESIREYGKNPQYKESNLTALLGQLGVPKEFAPAFGKGFSDEEFSNAYNNAKINTNKEVEDAKRVNLAFSQLSNSFDVLKGGLLSRFADSIEKWIGFVDKLLEPENVEKLTKQSKNIEELSLGVLAAYLGEKTISALYKAGGGVAGKIGLKQGAKAVAAGAAKVGAVGAGGYAFYEFLSYLAEQNEKIYFPSRYKERMRERASKEAMENAREYNHLDNSDLSDRLEINPKRAYSQEDYAAEARMTAVNPTNNVNTTVNINAGSVDKTTAPYIANEINSNVNKSLYNSKYPTISVPK